MPMSSTTLSSHRLAIASHQVKNEMLYGKELEKQQAKLERDAMTWQRSENMRNAGLEHQMLCTP